MAEKNDYNKVYERLVTYDKDYVGMLAYAIYKKQKQVFIKEHCSRNNGKRPSIGEIGKFHQIAIQDDQLSLYRQKATELLQGFGNALIEEKKDDLKNFAISHIKPTSFWGGVWQNVVANGIWLLLVAVVAVILWSLDHGPFETFKSIVEKNSQKGNVSSDGS